MRKNGDHRSYDENREDKKSCDGSYDKDDGSCEVSSTSHYTDEYDVRYTYFSYILYKSYNNNNHKKSKNFILRLAVLLIQVQVVCMLMLVQDKVI